MRVVVLCTFLASAAVASSIVLPESDGSSATTEDSPGCASSSSGSSSSTEPPSVSTKRKEDRTEKTVMSTQQKVIKSTFSIAGSQWRTLDPFLFCAFHKDDYPEANGKLGPHAKELRGRDIGGDFAGKDGWNMYHGETIPGFPQHPHRGFETITITRSGWVDHFDSMGSKGRYGFGDTQWMTAGKGMQHCEMFPLLNTDKPNPMELFQVWINLPAKNKMVEPDYKMFWAPDTPILTLKQTGEGAEQKEIGQVRVIAGSEDYFKATYPDLKVCTPPSDSWASQPGSDVAVWDIILNPGSSYTFPKAILGAAVNRVLYFFEGDAASVGSEKLSVKTAAKLDGAQDFTLTVGPTSKKASFLVLQGKPIDEPVAQHGPFVMNTQAEIQQAFADYRRTQFGSWPFDSPDPTLGADAKKHATFPDGHSEVPAQ